MMHIRRWVYKRGYRPAPGSIFFSPSLNLIYALKDAQ